MKPQVTTCCLPFNVSALASAGILIFMHDKIHYETLQRCACRLFDPV